MEFYSAYNCPPSKAHKPCPMDDVNYVLDEQLDELVVVGTTPTYERIQSFYESTTLSCKLAKLAMGDSSALGNPGGSYGDFTQVPATLRDLLDSRKKIEEDFRALDPDIRAIFNNDFAVFESSVKDGTVNKRISDGLSSRGTTGTSSGGTGTSGSGSGTNGSVSD